MDETNGHGDGDVVQALWRYPIKSMMGEAVSTTEISTRGLLGDRAYALVDKASNRAAAVRTWAAGLMTYRARFLEEPRAAQTRAPVQITLPDGAALVTTQPDIDERLSERLGRRLSLMSHAPDGVLLEFPAGTLAGKASEVTETPLAGQAPAGTFFDLAAVHLLAASTLDHLQAGYPQGLVDLQRFRPNIVVRGADEPFVENRWLGRKFAVGEAVLRVSMPCPRCVNITLPQEGLPRESGLLRHVAASNMIDLGAIGRLPCVGVYADVLSPGRISIGDALRWLD